MALNEEVTMLRQVPLFAGVSPPRLKLIAFSSERVTYRPGEILCLQGEAGDAAFVILSGLAEVLVDGPKGPNRVAELSENAVVGEIAILCDVARTATVKAVTQVEALRIGKENFLKLMHDFPEMAIEVVRVLADRLSRTTQELAQAKSRLEKGMH
ncbi:MAG: cyclic nucleotide-binding domain-containing protein [Paracoccaceae bacterium]|nr:MAG: cyclic nucleotide-binding domain-containing protein [Paracoccaceae bacterium]